MVTVVFYMFTDMVLFSQYLYYKIKNSSTRGKRRDTVSLRGEIPERGKLPRRHSQMTLRHCGYRFVTCCCMP